MCSTHRPFVCCCSSQRACTRQFLGFHIKTSPCFKVKLGFIERLNPERELTQFFFLFWWLPMPQGNIFKSTSVFIRHAGWAEKVGLKVFIPDCYGPARLEFCFSRPCILMHREQLQKSLFQYRCVHEPLLSWSLSVVSVTRWWQAFHIFFTGFPLKRGIWFCYFRCK